MPRKKNTTTGRAIWPKVPEIDLDENFVTIAEAARRTGLSMAEVASCVENKFVRAIGKYQLISTWELNTIRCLEGDEDHDLDFNEIDDIDYVNYYSDDHREAQTLVLIWCRKHGEYEHHYVWLPTRRTKKRANPRVKKAMLQYASHSAEKEDRQ